MFLHTNGWTKIDCIKMFRAMTSAGLVEAKYSVEAFLDAFGLDKIETFYQVNLFINYTHEFSLGKIKMGENNEVVWNKSPVLSVYDIRHLCEGD